MEPCTRFALQSDATPPWLKDSTGDRLGQLERQTRIIGNGKERLPKPEALVSTCAGTKGARLRLQRLTTS